MSITYSPKIRITIQDLVTTEVLYEDELSDDLLNLSTNKAYGRCAGTWQLTLPMHKPVSWADTIAPNMVITIEMDAGYGAGFVPVMCGFVDRVSEVWSQGPVPHRQVKLSGQDYGKILAKHNIGWNATAANHQVPTTNGKQVDWVSYQRLYLLTPGTADNIIKQLYNIFTTDMAASITCRLNYEPTTQDTFMLHDVSMALIQQESIWDAMKRCAHEPFNMLHCDTSEADVNKFTIILEPQPIDDYGKLLRTDPDRIHTIDETDITFSDVGVSDIERINLLLYWNPLVKAATNESGLSLALANPHLAKKSDDPDNRMDLHGYNVRVQYDQFVSSIEKGGKFKRAETPKAIDEYVANANKLWNWWGKNHTLKSGTIQTHLRPDIRTGNCLLVKNSADDTYTEFLVEQVSHQCSWNPAPEFTTTLHVTRGQLAPPNKTELAVTK